MARIHDLPNEILEVIIQAIPGTRSKANFGQTCREIWTVAKPEIFRSVKFSASTPKSGFSVFLAAMRHSEFIKELTVELTSAEPLMGCDACAEDVNIVGELCDFDRDEELWQTAVAPVMTLLRGDHPGLLSNLEKLNIEYPKYYDDYPQQDMLQQVTDKVIDRADAVLSAAASNRAQRITTLRLLRLSPRAEYFYTSSWTSILNRLEHFELSLSIDINEQDDFLHEDWEAQHEESEQPVYSHFAVDLRREIFDKLTSVKTVEIEGSKECRIGRLAGAYSVPLHLGRKTMPKLESLELASTVFDSHLIDFLRYRPTEGLPLSLTLTNTMCFRRVYLDEDDGAKAIGMRWEPGFNKMAEILESGKTPGIKSFKASFLDMAKYPPFGYRYSNSPAVLAGYDKVTQQMLQLAASKPMCIMFPYVQHDKKDNHFWADKITAMRNFKAGKDQAAYDRFLAEVARVSEELAKKDDQASTD